VKFTDDIGHDIGGQPEIDANPLNLHVGQTSPSFWVPMWGQLLRH
jgi:hypothetical protein